jgi:protein subunit release factor A
MVAMIAMIVSERGQWREVGPHRVRRVTVAYARMQLRVHTETCRPAVII